MECYSAISTFRHQGCHWANNNKQILARCSASVWWLRFSRYWTLHTREVPRLHNGQYEYLSICHWFDDWYRSGLQSLLSLWPILPRFEGACSTSYGQDHESKSGFVCVTRTYSQGSATLCFWEQPGVPQLSELFRAIQSSDPALHRWHKCLSCHDP